MASVGVQVEDPTLEGGQRSGHRNRQRSLLPLIHLSGRQHLRLWRAPFTNLVGLTPGRVEKTALWTTGMPGITKVAIHQHCNNLRFLRVGTPDS